jgi:uncharacterized protein
MEGVEGVHVFENAKGAIDDFEPHPLLRDPHVATVTAAYYPRTASALPVTERLFEVEPGTRLLAKCHWQAKRQECPAIVLVHGFEGSSESPYMLGTAQKAFDEGFSVIRLNQRNRGARNI